MKEFIEVTDPNFLLFLQTKKFKGALCDKNGKANNVGPYINPLSEIAKSKISISIRQPPNKEGSSWNAIKNIDGIQAFENCENLSAKLIGLEILNTLPKNLKSISLFGNKLKNTQFLRSAPTLKKVDISNNSNIQLSLIEGIKELDCSNCELEILPTLPITLEVLDCANNELTSLPKLPQNLQKINCQENKIKELPVLPINLKELDVSYNKLLERPEHPSADIDLQGNRFKKIKKNKKSIIGSGENDNYELKLAVISELCKTDKKLNQKLHQLMDDADQHLDILMYGFLYDVREFVQKLKISSKKLTEINNLRISRANSAIFYLDPTMDYEVEDYDVSSFDGILELTNLKTLEIESGIDEDIDWTPIVNHPNLKKIIFDKEEIMDFLYEESERFEIKIELASFHFLNEKEIPYSYFNPED